MKGSWTIKCNDSPVLWVEQLICSSVIRNTVHFLWFFSISLKYPLLVILRDKKLGSALDLLARLYSWYTVMSSQSNLVDLPNGKAIYCHPICHCWNNLLGVRWLKKPEKTHCREAWFRMICSCSHPENFTEIIASSPVDFLGSVSYLNWITALLELNLHILFRIPERGNVYANTFFFLWRKLLCSCL